jgi:apolipoprotein N-acyltransferase
VLIFQEDEKEILSEVIRRAKENKIYLGLGLAVMDLKIRQGKKGLSRCIHNKLVLISPEGKVAWQHSKSKLTPGIEAACMIPGDGKLKSESKGNAIITGAICYEMDFPEYIREAGKMNANLLLAPSNDWADIKNTHARMARLRAIENGVAILRSASGGISIAVDSSGRVLSRSDYYHNAGEVVFCALPLENISTVYAKIGDLFPWICIISSILMILLSLFRFFASRNIN